MFGRKKKERLSWSFIQNRYPDVAEGLKSLREWDSVKASLADAERLGDYSILALHAIVALKRELHTEIEMVSERLYTLSSKLDALRTDADNSYKRLEKEIAQIKDILDELERRTLLISNVEKMLPRLAELEEKMATYPLEVAERLEKRYIKELQEKAETLIREIVEEKIEELEERLNTKGFGPEAIREVLTKYEKALLENVELKKELERKDKLIRELSAKVSKLQEGAKKVEEIEKRVDEYKRLAEEVATIRAKLAQITGRYNVQDALKALEKEFIPRSKVEELAKSVKKLMEENEELKKENERLRKELERINQAVKVLIEEGLITTQLSQEG
ncbi:hypothetical protein [Pyrococcus yayanosii]|uniref:Uncharacterized protein n=1 Tax=Pyrococcus yayanosii (strain CH1 / JCM 16557) TaxID=529709 RepID=F8AF94_PYRYC|nr:hypothetical protein [Pyrococcus yayanosii]AEH24924.1 hypothetical protein PYCH_12460 [Pyrococcus yayanosii CH1]